MDRETAYKVLDLKPSASGSEIKEAYRTLTKEYHPDLTDGETREHWIRINEAKETLLNGNHATTDGHQQTADTTTNRTTRSNAGSTDANAQSQRSYQRDHTDRERRHDRTNSS